MLIILEGPDGSGKTTLAEDIVDVIGGSISHFSAPQQHPWAEYATPLAKFERELGDNAQIPAPQLYAGHFSPHDMLIDRDTVSGARRGMICDRYHWGDLVYRPRFLDMPSSLGLDGFHGINRSIAELGGLIVLVTAPVDQLLARVEARSVADGTAKEIYEDPAQQGAIHSHYEQLFAEAHQRDGMAHHLLRIDTSVGDRKTNAYTVLDAALKAFIRQRDWEDIPSPEDLIFDTLAPEPDDDSPIVVADNG